MLIAAKQHVVELNATEATVAVENQASHVQVWKSSSNPLEEADRLARMDVVHRLWESNC